MDIGAPVQTIGAGGRAHVDVRAAGGTLLRVVHAGVDAQFLNRLRSGRRQSLPDRQIGRCGALNFRRAGLGGAADPGVIYHASRRHGTGALPIEQIAGVDAVQQKGIAGVALPIGPDRLVTQSSVRTCAARQLRVYTRRENCQPRETAGGQRHIQNLIFLQNVSVRGVHRVQQRIGFHCHSGTNLPHLHRYVQCCGAVRLHGNGRNFLGLESFMRERQRVRANRQVHKVVDAACVGGQGAR